uniref:Putative ovule protein n=1 Tax=Solanum chacoense TaxID=4108 RepID=A0A0V0GTS4_SOLCH
MDVETMTYTRVGFQLNFIKNTELKLDYLQSKGPTSKSFTKFLTNFLTTLRLKKHKNNFRQSFDLNKCFYRS